MRINELTEEEILEFLMTNELEGDYSPTELKYLLSKWRYFYRINLAKNEQAKHSYESQIDILTKKVDDLEYSNNELLIQNANKDNIIDSIKNRKLTFRERWYGEIITKNESK
jgi:hypothetical protein